MIATLRHTQKRAPDSMPCRSTMVAQMTSATWSTRASGANCVL